MTDAPAAEPAAPVREPFGTLPDGTEVDRWSFADPSGLAAGVLTYGAILQTLTVPAPAERGGGANVVLGFANLDDYLHRSPYFGCVVGRYANRIAAGRFELDGREYRLPLNDDPRPNALHGGPGGFHARVWAARPIVEPGRVGVELTLTSEDGDQGFPGRVEVTMRYVLSGGALHMEYEATTDAATVVNLTNHSYFNLAGEGAGTIDAQVLTLAAPKYLPVDDNLIPTSAPTPVDGTRFDFTTGAALDQSDTGYDHCFVFGDGTTAQPREVGSLSDPASGRVMRLLTTEPGIQVFTADTLSPDLVGTSGKNYGPRAAVALETQHFPDSPNRPDYPSTVLRPGETFRSTTVLSFPHLA